MTRAYIALGANLGDRQAAIESAIVELATFGEVAAVSSIYETDPVGFADQPSYLNAAVGIDTGLAPDEVLDAILEIERAHGRVRTFRNAPRTLDLDLLLFGDQQRSTARLRLPHPRMHERAFVLVPLAEIAPDIAVPGLGATVAEILARLDDRTGVRLFSSAKGAGTNQ